MSENSTDPPPFPKWMTPAVWGLLVYSALVFLGAILNIDAGQYGPLMGGSALAAFGLIFVLAGAFGADFRGDDNGGDDGLGTPAPDGFGRPLSIICGLPFVIIGIVFMFP